MSHLRRQFLEFFLIILGGGVTSACMKSWKVKLTVNRFFEEILSESDDDRFSFSALIAFCKEKIDLI